MKYYYEPNDKWYDTKQELVDAWNEDFEGTHSTKVTIDNWTEEQWNTIWGPKMKKIEIKTEKANLLVVDLPKEAKHFETAFDYKNYYLCWHDGQRDEHGFICGNHNQITLGKGKYKHLGKVSEITEEEWNAIVDDPFVKGVGQYVKPDNLEGWTVVNAAMGVQYQKYSHISFKDYQIKTDGFSIAKQYPFKTASESGLSLLKANGVVLDSPENPFFISNINSEEDRAKSQEQMENYFNELSKVWSNPHVFIKIERGN